MLPKYRKPSHPGVILSEDFLRPMGVTQSRFATHLGWSHAKINEIINGRRGITAETALCFADAFGTSPEFWLNLQTNHDLWEAQQEHKRQKKIA